MLSLTARSQMVGTTYRVGLPHINALYTCSTRRTPAINLRHLGAAHAILVPTRPFSCTNLISHKWVHQVGSSRLWNDQLIKSRIVE